MHHLKGQHVLILGLGASGLAMVKWCLTLGASVSVADTRAEPPNLEILKRDCPQAQFIGGPFTAELLHQKAKNSTHSENENIRAVFKSPGLSPVEVEPVWRAAKEMGLWVGTELSLFAKAMAELKEEMGYEPNVLCVTGTNGKTTVTSLAAQMLSRGGLRTVVAGNIGPTLLDTLAERLNEIRDIPEDEDEQEDLVPEGAGIEVLKDKEQLNEHEHENANEQSSPKVTAKEAHVSEGENAHSETNTDEAHLEVSCAGEHTQPQAQDSELSANEATEITEITEITKITEEGEETEEAASVGLVIQELNPHHKKFKSKRSALPQVWVLELSSFQLNDCDNFDPTAAVVLNITEDHLDWHGDMASYIHAKSKIFGNHTHQILCRDDPVVLSLRSEQLDAKALKKAKAEAQQNEQEWFDREVITYGSDLPTEPGHYGLETVNAMTWLVKAVDPNDDEGEVKSRRKKTPVQVDELIMHRLMPADALRIRGAHNALNALAALALCSTSKATSQGHGPMLYALREYRGEPHRVEPVMRINEVEYFDDSKGTNVGATTAAIKGLGAEFSLIVILGGEGKGQDFTPLADPLSKHAKLVILLGRDAPIIKEAIHSAGVEIINATSMNEAVQLAHQHAHSGDAVLMSPACASFDMFNNYEHRAEVFINAVRDLSLEEGLV